MVRIHIYSSNISVILNEQKTFYKTLFTSEGSNEPEANALLDKVDKVLNEEEKEICDAEITEQETYNTIKL